MDRSCVVTLYIFNNFKIYLFILHIIHHYLQLILILFLLLSSFLIFTFLVLFAVTCFSFLFQSFSYFLTLVLTTLLSITFPIQD